MAAIERGRDPDGVCADFTHFLTPAAASPPPAAIAAATTTTTYALHCLARIPQSVGEGLEDCSEREGGGHSAGKGA